MVGWWLGVSAAASPGSAGAVHLGASPLPEGTQFVGSGGGIAWAGASAVGAPILEAGTALGERFALVGTIGVGLGAVPSVPVLVSSRYLAIDTPDVRFAVTLSAAVLQRLEREPWGIETHLAPGLALDAGGERVRFDAAVPIWGVSSYNQYIGIERFPVPLLSTAGVSFALGDTQRLRLGLPDLVSWHYRGESVYVDIGGVTVLVAGAVWIKVGAVF